jgi:RHS repeat-associated protein
LKNKFTFQGQEVQDDLNLGWVQFKWRNHDSAIGRFFNIDPLAESFYYNSPYAFSENKITAHVELEGLEAFSIHGTNSDPSTFTKNQETIPTLQELSGNSTINNEFIWPEGTNGFSNDQADRSQALWLLLSML